MKTRLTLCAASIMAIATAPAEEFNYDEAKVPSYALPDPLEGVSDADGWPVKRAELYELLATEMFGKAPDFDTAELAVTRDIPDTITLGGKAILSQPKLELAGTGVRLLIIRPADAEGPVPAFMGYNFAGNHTVHADPKITLTDAWVRGKKDTKASDKDRGSKSSRWDVESIVGRGYALITAYYGDVDPDFDDGFENGVHAKLGKPSGPDAWGSIATWAWGLSRFLDFLEKETAIDAGRVAVIGHSRLGKTSLWAGASDERFALVISNNSGCGGAALSRRRFGETVNRINSSFPHWFCGNFKKYNNKEDDLPFDQHTLLALIAPRPLYVASAKEDRWADPRGEFLSAVGATPVYRLLGTGGLPAETFPEVDKPVQGQVGYHIRSGKHDVTRFDWEQYLRFADKHLKPE